MNDENISSSDIINRRDALLQCTENLSAHSSDEDYRDLDSYNRRDLPRNRTMRVGDYLQRAATFQIGIYGFPNGVPEQHSPDFFFLNAKQENRNFIVIKHDPLLTPEIPADHTVSDSIWIVSIVGLKGL